MALALTACSVSKLAYQSAPGLGYWWLDSYFDFTEAQSLRLRDDLAALQTWHRQHELPVFVRTLDDLQRSVLQDTTAQRVCDLYSDFGVRLQAALDHFEPTVTALAPTLQPAQIDHLARQLDKRSQQWRSEWLDVTPAARQERRVRQMTERTEMFYGRLEPTQLAALQAGLATVPLDVELMQREWQRRQQDIVRTLRHLKAAPHSASDISSALRALLARAMDPPDAVLRSYRHRVVQGHCSALAALHNSSTAAQRAHFAETLKDYQADARSLLLLPER